MIKWLLTGLLLSIGILCLTQSADGCMCALEHAQTMFCKADYVILVRVEGKKRVDRNDIYKIRIKEIYKSKQTEDFKQIVTHGRISTADSDSMCGIALDLDRLYVIAASTTRIGICDYVKAYSDMSHVERDDFAGAYEKGCACKIKVTRVPARRAIGTCNWQIRSKRRFDHCVPSRGNVTTDGRPVKCHWRKNKKLKHQLWG